MFGDIKSIAELAVRDWCRSIGLDMHYIKLGMDGNEAMIEDDIGNTLRLPLVPGTPQLEARFKELIAKYDLN